MMKKFIKYFAILTFALASIACDKSQEGKLYDPTSDDSRGIHFIQTSIDKTFPSDSTSGSIEVEIARSGNKGEYAVFLSKKGDNPDLFNVPEKVVIPDGAYSTKFKMDVNLSDFIMGSSYKAEVYISDRDIMVGENDTQISQYSDKLKVSASYELEWETLYRTNSEGESVPQLATYHYSLYYTGNDTGLEVEKAVGTDNIFRLNDWGSGVSFRFILNEDNTCTVPAQSIGYFNSNYNEYVQVADMAVYTNDESAYSSYPCTYDGNGKFSFSLIYYVSSGYFARGTETLDFESEPDKTPVVEISYDGIKETETGFKAPSLSFEPNEYVKYYKVTIVSGDITKSNYQLKDVRDKLISNTLSAAAPVVTYYEKNSSIWNIKKGNFTAVALAYDSDDKPGELLTERFTFDPEDEFTPKVDIFQWYNSESNINYSAYNTLFWDMKVRNVASMKYLCIRTDAIKYLVTAGGKTLAELTDENGSVIPEETLEQLLSDEGRNSVFNTLNEGTGYTICALMTNAFGDKVFVSADATTKGRLWSDFDKSKTFDDYLGAFVVTADVNVQGGSTAEKSFRMDITKINDNEALVNGVSDMRDFIPTIRALYDEDLHMLIVEPQSTGIYQNTHTMMSLTDGLSYYWGSGSLAIGYIGDKLYWRASPYSETNCYGYLFLQFSSESANGNTYLKEYVGGKTYSYLSMEKIDGTKATTYTTTSVESPARKSINDPRNTLLVNDKTIRLEQMAE